MRLKWMRPVRQVPEMPDEFFDTTPQYAMGIHTNKEVNVGVFDPANDSLLAHGRTELRYRGNLRDDWAVHIVYETEEVNPIVLVRIREPGFLPIEFHMALEYGRLNNYSVMMQEDTPYRAV